MNLHHIINSKKVIITHYHAKYQEGTDKSQKTPHRIISATITTPSRIQETTNFDE